MATLLLPGNAVPADVSNGKTFSAGINFNAPGTLPVQGAITITPSNVAQAIPQGNHNGAGQVTGVVVPAANVLTGTTIAGVPGSMPNNGAIAYNAAASPVAIANGNHTGSTVAAVTFPASNVLTGTTIAGTAGTMPENGAPIWTPTTADQGVTAGHYTGGTVKGSAALVPGNILNGVNIFGVVGTLTTTNPVYLSAPTQRQTNNAVSVIQKRVTINVAANVRIQIDIAQTNNAAPASVTAIATFYKNGVSFGSGSNFDVFYATVSAATTCVPGDVIEVGMSGNDASLSRTSCKNFLASLSLVSPTGGAVNLD